MRSCTLLLLLLAVPPAWLAPKPHLFMVFVDDWGWRDGPAALRRGNGLVTPGFDSLVEQGITFSRMYAFRYCSPTRSSFLSGRLPIHVNQINLPNDARGGGVHPGMTTIGSKLKAVGYRTVAIGKWHCGMSQAALVPKARGFDRNLGYLAGSEDHFTHAGGSIGCKESGVDAGGGGEGITKLLDMYDSEGPVLDTRTRYGGVYNGEIFGSLAVETIDEPLFIYLAFANAHHPMEVPPTWLGLYPNVTTMVRRTYQAMVSYVDVAISNLTAVLEARGMWRNSLLVVASDNGGPSLTDLDTSNNYPLRGGKYSLFDGGMRVTAFVAGGVVPMKMRGATLDILAHTADLHATLCSVAGAAISDDAPSAANLPPVDAVSLWPSISGGGGDTLRTELPLSIGPPGDDGCGKDKFGATGGALIHGRYKLIVGRTCPAHWTGPDSPNGTASVGLVHDCGAGGCLFDLVNDPTEHVDLALAAVKANQTLAEVLNSMVARMEALNATTYQTPWDASPITKAECSTDLMKSMLKGGVWAPWQEN